MLNEYIQNEIKRHIEKIIEYYKLTDTNIKFDVSEPPLKEYGDYSSNIAFILSKMLRKNPLEIAKEIVDRVLPALDKPEKNNQILESITYEKPGFINFKINLKLFVQQFFLKLDKIIEIPRLAQSDNLILIEHTSVNPNKSLHVGHVRNCIIGDCIYRLLSLTNHNVKVLNYIDDSGLQVADIVVAFKYANFYLPSNDNSEYGKFDSYCGNHVYVKINDLYSQNPDLELKRKDILKELENPSSDISIFTNQIVRRVLVNQLQTCWKLKCHYDILNFESHIFQSDLWNKIFEWLKEKKIITLEKDGKNKGCWIFKSYTEGDKILVRSDTTLTYFAKDIPYAVWKLGFIKNPFGFKYSLLNGMELHYMRQF
ncbi:MAG: arginine--tRNA ligase [Thermoproteota archaeon]|nr:arginine--tRNA ligase [Thermoproteota archaeon]